MKKILNFIGSVIVLALVILVVTFPASWLLMLTFGNLGIGLSYWGALPLGILVSALIGAAASTDSWNYVVVREAVDTD